MPADIAGPPPRNEKPTPAQGGASQRTSTPAQYHTPADGKTSGKPGRLSFLVVGVSELERQARCRELRALSLLLLGHGHAATVALAAAIADPAATDRALRLVDALPALRHRRLLASYTALLERGGR
jgi:hypothetical protein